MSQPQEHSEAGRIVSMENSNDTIGNRTRYLPACSAVPQPNAPPRAPTSMAWAEINVHSTVLTMQFVLHSEVTTAVVLRGCDAVKSGRRTG